MATKNPRGDSPKRVRKSARPRKTQKSTKEEPLLSPDDARTILFDLATRLAPADVAALITEEHRLRERAAQLKGEHLVLLRGQVDLALECLRDHVDGACPQIPYYTIALLAAGIYYFTDELDIIPDFLPGVGRLDDAMVMAIAYRLAADGVRRYCAWKGRDAGKVLSTAAQ